MPALWLPPINIDIAGALGTFLGTVVPSMVLALLALRLSVRQYSAQKLWEKKYETYYRVLEKLALLRDCHYKWLENGIGERNLDDEYQKELNTQFRSARQELDIAVAAGSFILSDDAASSLDELLSRLGKISSEARDWFEDINGLAAALREYIPVFREYAKSDLARARSFWRF